MEYYTYGQEGACINFMYMYVFIVHSVCVYGYECVVYSVKHFMKLCTYQCQAPLPPVQDI